MYAADYPGYPNLTDDQLLKRAVRSAKHPHRRTYRWVGVMEAFALGSTAAQALCRRFGLDPDEKV